MICEKCGRKTNFLGYIRNKGELCKDCYDEEITIIDYEESRRGKIK